MKTIQHPTSFWGIYVNSTLVPTRFIFPILFLFLFTATNAQEIYNIDQVDGDILFLPDEYSTITIYDSGGPNGNYLNYEDYQVTICSGVQLAGCPDIPELNALFIQFDIEAQATCSYDGLQVNGGDAFCNGNYPPLWGTTVPSVINSDDGCITLHFYSDYSITGEGFKVTFSADHVSYSPVVLTCGSSIQGSTLLPFEGCYDCIGFHDCGGSTYGPYIAQEAGYYIEGEGLMNLTILGDVDFFVYGMTTNIGPNGCPPITSIGCATGNESSVIFNASDYPYGIWVIIDSNGSDDFSIELTCDSGCNSCDRCFGFVPRYQANAIMDFENHYCGGGIATRSAITYHWDVSGINETYINGTNSASENPSILFPGAGSYTVCQQVFSFGLLVFECCHTVFVGPCSSPPIAFFTAQLGTFNRFILNADANGNQVQWTFSDPDVSFFQGNANSINPVIIIPSGKCVTACCYETNACGTSSYCMELCLQNPSCGGSIPPVYMANAIEPGIEGKTVQITLPNPPSGGQPIYAWDFGDGNFASTRNITHTFEDYGNYNVCVTVTVGCRTWCYCWCIPLNPCVPEYTYNEGDLNVAFTGTESLLQYTFTSGIPKAPGESWLINGESVTGNSTSLVYTFSSAGYYTVCFPYTGPDGCIDYYCVDVNVANPFACNSITWQFSATSGYQFTIASGSTDILWTIDETGQQIGQSNTSNWILPIAPCGWKTISVRYFDGLRYRICCLRIYLCPPDECYSSIEYGYLASTNEATFRLNTTGNTDISWYYDDAPGQILGTNASITLPYPAACLSKTVSVKYKDNAGRWHVCCRLIYFCNPVACSSIGVNYSDSLGYSFTVQQAEQNMSWIVEETGTSLGTNQVSQYFPAGPNCDYRTISLRYWIPGTGWKLCCVRIYWCNPATCSDNIYFISSGNTLGVQAPDYLQNVTWYKDAVPMGTANPLLTSLSLNTSHKICLRYFDPCDGAWKWCCRTYTPGSTSGTLTFDVENNICGEQNQVVEIPLRVRAFTDIINFQFSVQLEDTTKGRLVSIVPQAIPGDFDSYISNAGTGTVYWESGSSVTLPENTVIAQVRVRILSSVAGVYKINITGTPNPIYAEDGSGNPITPIVQEGSYCFESLVNVCGRITREDLVPIANVNVSLNGCKRYSEITDANGHYCFTDIPAGATYEIVASKDVNYKNGVNTGDLSAIKRHILGSVKLNSPYKIAAGDAKKSNSVNTGDISEIRRLIQGVYTDFPTCESWEFTDKNYVFPTPSNPFGEEWPARLVLQNIQQDIANADMIGWKMGDVNLSNNPQNLDPDGIETRSLTDLYLYLSPVNIPDQDTFLMDVAVKQFSDILNGSFSIRFDPEKLELLGITAKHPALNLSDDEFVINGTSGNLVFVWEASSGVTLADSSILFSLRFVPKDQSVDKSEVYFSSEPAEIYFENEDGEILNVITSDASVSVPVRELRKAEIVLHPNPVSDELNIRILFERPASVRVELISEMGAVIRRLDESRSGTTVYEGTLNLGDLPAGIYLVRVLTEEGSVTRRIIHL